MTQRVFRQLSEDGVHWETEVVNDTGGGGTAPVSAVIARDNPFTVRTVDQHEILWDALYDNYQDFGVLLEIPAGLGLTFAFDGSSADITTTEAGVWALTYNLAIPADASWIGNLNMGMGLSESLPVSAAAGVAKTPTAVVAMPTGTTITPNVNTSVQATDDPFACGSAYLIATRIG